jgi:phage shock protein PspC (stress-responsive transcriptional regulator)
MASHDPHDRPAARRPGAVPAGIGGFAREEPSGGSGLGVGHEEPGGGFGSGPEDLRDPGFRRLTRSRDDRVLAGVSGGLGRYFRIDPIIFRLAFGLLIFLGGAGVIAYAAAWLVLPPEGGRGALSGIDARRLIGRTVLAFVLLGAAFVAAFAVFVGAAFGGGGWLAGLVLVAGVVMILAGLSGRARLGRWAGAVALVVAIPLAVVAAVGIDAEGGVGDREYRPLAAGDIRDRYELGMGELVVDLRDANLPDGRTDLAIEVGIGSAVVLVADDVCVSSRVEIGAGDAYVLGRNSSGVDVDVEWLTRDSADPGPVLMVDAEVGAGALEVLRGSEWERPWTRDRDSEARMATPMAPPEEPVSDGCGTSP